MESLMELFARGGVLMWVLLGFSVVSVAVIFERGVVYVGYGLGSDAWMARFLDEVRSGRVENAQRMARACRHPVARVAEEYLANLGRPSKIRRDNVGLCGMLVLEDVERRLRVLATIAHLAPLVGLLGTVVGMVVAFAQIQALEGSAKPADLAGGIWEALLTTVFGLVVAIPSMAAFHGFESHADKIARRMEMAVTSLDDIFGDDLGPGMPVAHSTGSSDDWNSVG